MNTKYPHDIIDETELGTLTPRERKLYRPIPVSKVAHLQGLDPDQRAAWMAEHLPSDADRTRVMRAIAKRERKGSQNDATPVTDESKLVTD